MANTRPYDFELNFDHSEVERASGIRSPLPPSHPLSQPPRPSPSSRPVPELEFEDVVLPRSVRRGVTPNDETIPPGARKMLRALPNEGHRDGTDDQVLKHLKSIFDLEVLRTFARHGIDTTASPSTLISQVTIRINLGIRGIQLRKAFVAGFDQAATGCITRDDLTHVCFQALRELDALNDEDQQRKQTSQSHLRDGE